MVRIAVPLHAAALQANDTDLVVIGAHHFGHDANDPIAKEVMHVRWRSVLLVEASPPIASELAAAVALRNPTPLAPRDRINVINEGVCPFGAASGSAASSLPFYSFNASGLHGLPFWATQINSFSLLQVEHSVHGMERALADASQHRQPRGSDASRPSYTYERLRANVVRHNVTCRPLLSTLRVHGARRIGVLLVDTEGLDCDVIASQNWSSPQW
jgi:hypothetical protein